MSRPGPRYTTPRCYVVRLDRCLLALCAPKRCNFYAHRPTTKGSNIGRVKRNIYVTSLARRRAALLPPSPPSVRVRSHRLHFCDFFLGRPTTRGSPREPHGRFSRRARGRPPGGHMASGYVHRTSCPCVPRTAAQRSRVARDSLPCQAVRSAMYLARSAQGTRPHHVAQARRARSFEPPRVPHAHSTYAALPRAGTPWSAAAVCSRGALSVTCRVGATRSGRVATCDAAPRRLGAAAQARAATQGRGSRTCRGGCARTLRARMECDATHLSCVDAAGACIR